MKKILRDRKGVMLIEVVMALFVLGICGSAVLTIMMNFVTNDNEFHKKYSSLVACENAAECLRFAGGDAVTLHTALTNAEFEFDDNGTSDDPKDDVYTYKKENTMLP